MLHRSPRVVLLWAAALVVGLVTAVTVGRAVAGLRRQEATYGALRPVVVAARDLPLGMRIGTADLVVRRVRGEAPDSVRSTARAAGRVVAVPLLRGAPVTPRHLVPARRDGRAGTVPAGRRAMRVVVASTPRLTPGDLVDVYATFDPQVVGEDREPTLAVARAVPVLAVDAAAGGPGAVTEAGTGVTLLVPHAVAARLAFAAATGELAVAVAPPEAARVPSGP